MKERKTSKSVDNGFFRVRYRQAIVRRFLARCVFVLCGAVPAIYIILISATNSFDASYGGAEAVKTLRELEQAGARGFENFGLKPGYVDASFFDASDFSSHFLSGGLMTKGMLSGGRQFAMQADGVYSLPNYPLGNVEMLLLEPRYSVSAQPGEITSVRAQFGRIDVEKRLLTFSKGVVATSADLTVTGIEFTLDIANSILSSDSDVRVVGELGEVDATSLRYNFEDQRLTFGDIIGSNILGGARDE